MDPEFFNLEYYVDLYNAEHHTFSGNQYRLSLELIGSNQHEFLDKCVGETDHVHPLFIFGALISWYPAPYPWV